jgi:hypothetical protein
MTPPRGECASCLVASCRHQGCARLPTVLLVQAHTQMQCIVPVARGSGALALTTAAGTATTQLDGSTLLATAVVSTVFPMVWSTVTMTTIAISGDRYAPGALASMPRCVGARWLRWLSSALRCTLLIDHPTSPAMSRVPFPAPPAMSQAWLGPGPRGRRVGSAASVCRGGRSGVGVWPPAFMCACRRHQRFLLRQPNRVHGAARRWP